MELGKTIIILRQFYQFIYCLVGDEVKPGDSLIIEFVFDGNNKFLLQAKF